MADHSTDPLFIIQQVGIAMRFVLDAARMVLADHAVGADPTESLATLRRALDQYDRATDA